MRCPRCQTELATVVRDTPNDRVVLDVCPSCKGVWFDAGELVAVLALRNLGAFAPGSALLEGDRASRPCPRNPRVRMHERSIAASDPRLEPLKLDQCAECGGIWLDGGELEATLSTLKDRRVRPFLEDPETANMGSTSLWLFMFFTGLPIEQWNPRLRWPLIGRLLIAACLVVFVWQLSGDEESLQSTVFQHGLVPAHLFAGSYRALLTHMFLHGGVAHLVGNLYFLWVFGDNVEDRLGRLRFLTLYLLSGIAAGLCHSLFEPDGSIPVVGASGAIAGVMAAYAVLFPRHRLISLILFFRVRWRASVYLLGWLIFQLIGAFMHQPGIAWWAHIGGFLVGGLMALRMRTPPLRAPSSLAATAATAGL